MNDKEYYSIENQIKRNEESREREADKKRFKKLLNDPNFLIVPQWHLLKPDIDFLKLEDDQHIELGDVDSYELYIITKEELFRILDESFSSVYIKTKIWKNHDNDKIIKVLQNWEKNIKLIPPVVTFNFYSKKFNIQDGKHRFAVANYFEAETIPIIILKNEEVNFLANVNNEKINKK